MTPKLVGSHRFSQKYSQIKSVKKSADFLSFAVGRFFGSVGKSFGGTQALGDTFLPGTTNFSDNVTEPYKGISYPGGDLCRCFTKLTGTCAYTLHSNPIPPTYDTNGLL